MLKKILQGVKDSQELVLKNQKLVHSQNELALQDVLQNLNIFPIDHACFIDIVAKDRISKEDFFAQKSIFSPEDTLERKETLWNVLVEAKLLKPQGNFLYFYPDYSKFSVFIGNKLGDKFDDIYVYLKLQYQKILGSRKITEHTFSLFENENVRKKIIAKIFVEIRDEIASKFYDDNSRPFDFIKIVSIGKSYVVNDDEKSITVNKTKTGKYTLTINNENYGNLLTRKEYLVLINELKKDKVISPAAKRGLNEIVDPGSFLQVEELLLKYKDRLLLPYAADSRSGKVANELGVFKSYLHVGNAADLYHKILRILPQYRKNDLDLTNRFDEFFKLKMSVLADLNSMYLDKLRSHVNVYRIPATQGVGLAYEPEQLKEIYLVKDAEYELVGYFSLSKQVMALLLAVYLADKKLIKRLISGLSPFVLLQKNETDGINHIEILSSFGEKEKILVHDMADVMKLAAILHKIAQENLVEDRMYCDDLKILVNELLAHLTKLDKKNKEQTLSSFNLADYPLPYIWAMLKSAKAAPKDAYISRYLDFFEEIYERGINYYLLSAEEHRKHRRIIKGRPKNNLSEPGLFSRIYKARNYFFNPLSDFEKNKIYHQGLEETFFELRKYNSFNESMKEYLVGFEKKIKQSPRFLEAFFNEKVLTDKDVLYNVLLEKYQQRSGIYPQKEMDELTNVIEKLKLSRITMPEDKYVELSQEDRYRIRTLNWYILGLLVPSDSFIFEYIYSKRYGENTENFLVPMDTEKFNLSKRSQYLKVVVDNMTSLGFLDEDKKTQALTFIEKHKNLIEYDEKNIYLSMFKNALGIFGGDNNSVLEKEIDKIYADLFFGQGYAKYEYLVSQYYLAMDFILRYGRFKPIMEDVEKKHPEIFARLVKDNFIQKNRDKTYVLLNRAFETVDGIRPFTEDSVYKFENKQKFLDRINFLLNQFPQVSYFWEMHKIISKSSNVAEAFETLAQNNKYFDKLLGYREELKTDNFYDFLLKRDNTDRNRERIKIPIHDKWGADPITGICADTFYTYKLRAIFNRLILEIQEDNKSYVSDKRFYLSHEQIKEMYVSFNRLFLLGLFSKQINPEEELLERLLLGGVSLGTEQQKFLTNYIRIGRLLYSIIDTYEDIPKDRGGQRRSLKDIFLWETKYYGYDFPFTMINLIMTEQHDEKFLEDLFYQYSRILIENNMNATKYLPQFISANIEVPQMDNIYDLKYYEFITMLTYYGIISE